MSEKETFNIFQNYLLIIVFIADIFCLFIVWKLLKWKKINLFEEGGLKRKVSAKKLIISSITAFTGFMASNLLVSLLPVSFHNNAEEFSQSFSQMSQLSPWLSVVLLFVALCVTGPITEELIFRGIPIFIGKREGAKPWVCIFIGALVFGLAHWMGGGFGLVISGTILGLLFGFIYLQSGSLKTNMIAHGVVNFPAFFVLAFLPNQMDSELPELSGQMSRMLIIPILVYGIVCILGLGWLKNHPAEKLPTYP